MSRDVAVLLTYWVVYNTCNFHQFTFNSFNQVDKILYDFSSHFANNRNVFKKGKQLLMIKTRLFSFQRGAVMFLHWVLIKITTELFQMIQAWTLVLMLPLNADMELVFIIYPCIVGKVVWQPMNYWEIILHVQVRNIKNCSGKHKYDLSTYVLIDINVVHSARMLLQPLCI